MKVEFHKHNIGPEELKAVEEITQTPFLSTGKKVEELEEALKEYLGADYVVAVSSCTMALFLSLKRLKVRSGDIVITTPLSFIATANAIEYTGANTYFVDVDSTGCIDLKKLSEALETLGTRIKAIVPIHVYGQLCNPDISNISAFYKVPIVEDAAHALTTPGVGRGDFACFSFYATKEAASVSGDGGAIAFHNEEDLEKLKELRIHGQTSSAWGRYSTGGYKHWDMKALGYKAAMGNTSAASLVPQIRKANKYREIRKQLFQSYQIAFKDIEGLEMLEIKQAHSYLYATILVQPEKRDKILEYIKSKEVGCLVNWNPIHLMSYYKTKYGYKVRDFLNTERIGSSIISLPLYPRLLREEQTYVIEIVKEAIKE